MLHQDWPTFVSGQNHDLGPGPGQVQARTLTRKKRVIFNTFRVRVLFSGLF